MLRALRITASEGEDRSSAPRFRRARGGLRTRRGARVCPRGPWHRHVRHLLATGCHNDVIPRGNRVEGEGAVPASGSFTLATYIPVVRLKPDTPTENTALATDNTDNTVFGSVWSVFSVADPAQGRTCLINPIRAVRVIRSSNPSSAPRADSLWSRAAPADSNLPAQPRGATRPSRRRSVDRRRGSRTAAR